MKKTGIIILAVWVLLTSFRMGVSAHLCAGKVVNVQLSILGHRGDCKEMQPSSKDCAKHALGSSCCQDKAASLILPTTRIPDANTPLQIPSTALAWNAQPHSICLNQAPPATKSYAPLSNAPPYPGNSDLLKMICRFMI